MLRVKPSCASRHLSELERVGFVTHRRQGPWAFHRLDTGGSNRYVRPLLDLLSGWLVHDEQIQMDRKRSEALGQ